MKRIITILIFTIFCLSIQAQYTSEGTDFWLTFMGQDSVDRIEVGDEPLQLFLLASSRKACTGTVSNPNTGYSQTFSISPGTVTRIDIPPRQAYCSSDNATVRILDKGIHVQSSDTISLYLSNYSDANYDAAGVLPVKSLGTEYRSMGTSHETNQGKTYFSDGTTSTFYFENYSTCAIVATEDNTTVRFKSKEGIGFFDSGNIYQSYYSNNDYFKQLKKGQVLLITENGMLGLEIESDACKPIAVFSGNYCSNVPFDCRACDLLVEQMAPVDTWGKEFIVTPTLKLGTRDSKIQIISLENNTQVVQKVGNAPSTTSILNTGSEIWIDTDVNGGNYITSNKPIAVAQYAVGKEYRGIGDPFMILINPVEQKIKSVVFAPTQTARIAAHYVMIVVETDAVNKTFLDGLNVGAQFDTIPANPFFSVARIIVTPTSHELKNDEGFTAYVYGYGNYESYGYSAGTSVRNTLNDWWVKSASGQDVDYYETSKGSNTYTCGEEFGVSWDIKSPVNSVKLLLNGAEIESITGAAAAKNTRDYNATRLLAGENTLFLLLVDQCKTDTMKAKIWFDPPYYRILTPDTSLCENRTFDVLAETNLSANNPLVKYAWTPRSTNLLSSTLTTASIKTSANISYKTVVQCDGKYTITDSVMLDVLPSLQTHFYDTICANETYQFYGTSYNKEGVYSHKLSATNSCDSNLVLHLKVIPIITNIQTISFNWGDTIIVHGNMYTQIGEFTDKLLASTGCDSLVTTKIMFDYMTCPDLVAPKYFTPNADGVNDTYVIENIECFSKAYVEIYDRYGKLLVTKLSEDAGWDGNYLAKPMPTTDYWYVIVVPETGKRHVGHFTLVR